MKRTDGSLVLFFFNDTATTEIYTLSLHDALPISKARRGVDNRIAVTDPGQFLEAHPIRGEILGR